MKLSKILERLEYTCLQGTLDQEIEEVVADSRKAKEGSLFICIRGAVVDGHDVSFGALRFRGFGWDALPGSRVVMCSG